MRSGGQRRGFEEGGSYQGVEGGEEGPLAGVGAAGLGNPSLLDLVLLFERVDAVLTLDIGAAGLGSVVAMAGVDSGGDLLPVPLTEIAAVELQVTVAPGLDKRMRGVLAPTVLAAWEYGA